VNPPSLFRRRLALVAVFVVLLLAFLLALSYVAPDGGGTQVTLDQLRARVAEGQVATATLRDEDSRVVGTLKDGSRYWTSYPSSGAVTSALVEQLQASGATVDVDVQSAKQTVRAIATFLLPLLILADLFALVLSAGSGGGSGIGEVRSFGAGAGRDAPSDRITFADVAGADDAVAELAEVRDYLRDPMRYQRLGAVPPKGVLLFGPPGTGKTLLAKAVAGEAGVAFFSATGAEFVESLVGVGAARVRDLFARVRAAAPAIVFIDELDAAGRRRGSGGATGGSDEREQTLNQLLVEMDGFSVTSGIVVIGATNRPDIIDPALMRPGRFDRHVTVEAPDAVGRVKILALHAKGRPLAKDIDLAGLARRTPGFTGADLASVMNEGALLAARARSPRIEAAHLDDAVARVLHGTQRRGRLLTPEERHRLAVHESGHAVVAAAVGRIDDVHRVSILTGGKRLGGTSLSSDRDAAVVTESRLLARLATTMGGVAAELLVLGEASTGAEDDLEEATALARDLVGRYGMSPALGRARLLAADDERFLGEGTEVGALSLPVHEAFDREVSRLLAEAERRATEVLQSQRRHLDRLATRVVQAETVEGDDLLALLPAPVAVDARPAPRPRKATVRPAKAVPRRS
jgi:cell division protease FtsH